MNVDHPPLKLHLRRGHWEIVPPADTAPDRNDDEDVIENPTADVSDEVEYEDTRVKKEETAEMIEEKEVLLKSAHELDMRHVWKAIHHLEDSIAALNLIMLNRQRDEVKQEPFVEEAGIKQEPVWDDFEDNVTSSQSEWKTIHETAILCGACMSKRFRASLSEDIQADGCNVCKHQ